MCREVSPGTGMCSVTPALGRLKHKALAFKASLGCIDLSQKNKKSLEG
jgi:hypothetical protein